LETGPEEQGAVTPKGGVDEVFREALSLRLSADENRNAEDNAKEAQDKGTFAMP
jgi:hypothetical protein